MLEVAADNGWRVETRGSNHRQAYSPDGKYIITVAATPSDWRAHMNVKAQFKRAGLDFEQLEKEERARHKTLNMVRELLRDKPAKIWNFGDMVSVLRSVNPALTEGAVSGALNRLMSTGSIIRLGRGEYRWHQLPENAYADDQTDAPVAPVASDEASFSGEASAPQEHPVAAVAPVPSAPAPAPKTDEQQMSEAIDQLLSAIGTIQSLVSKAQATLQQVEEIKKAFLKI